MPRGVGVRVPPSAHFLILKNLEVDINLERENNSPDAVLSLNIKLEDFEEDANKSLKTAEQKLNLANQLKTGL